MAENHRTARGIPIDMDRLRLSNEQTIAVGNMRVNARGDQLGNGGKVIKTRQQIMAEKNKLHKSPLADEIDVVAESTDYVYEKSVTIDIPQPQTVTPTADETPVAESTNTAPNYVKPRGSFAGSVAEQTEVTQELLDPSVIGLGDKKQSGPQRL